MARRAPCSGVTAHTREVTGGWQKPLRTSTGQMEAAQSCPHHPDPRPFDKEGSGDQTGRKPQGLASAGRSLGCLPFREATTASPISQLPWRQAGIRVAVPYRAGGVLHTAVSVRVVSAPG